MAVHVTDSIDYFPFPDINLDFKAFPCKSAIDLTAVDSQGWSILHHVVSPMNYGTYDNVMLLKMLINAGAPLQQQDNAGLTPLDYALIRGAPKLAKAIQKLLGRKKEEWVGAGSSFWKKTSLETGLSSLITLVTIVSFILKIIRRLKIILRNLPLVYRYKITIHMYNQIIKTAASRQI